MLLWSEAWLIYIPPNPYKLLVILSKSSKLTTMFLLDFFHLDTKVFSVKSLHDMAGFLGALRPMVLGAMEWIPVSKPWNHPSNRKNKWMFVSQPKCFVANGQLTLKNGAPQTKILQKPSKLILRLNLHFFGGGMGGHNLFLKQKECHHLNLFEMVATRLGPYKLMVLK